MSTYGKPTLALKVGDRVLADPRRKDKWQAGEVTSDAPRIGVLCAGSVEWLIRVADGPTRGERWISEACIKVKL